MGGHFEGFGGCEAIRLGNTLGRGGGVEVYKVETAAKLTFTAEQRSGID